MHLLQMLEEELKVPLFVDRNEYQVLSLVNSAENPSETPLSTWNAELFEQRRIRLRVQWLGIYVFMFYFYFIMNQESESQRQDL